MMEAECRSGIVRKDGSDTSWCDGGDDLAYSFKLKDRDQAIAFPRGATVPKNYTKLDKMPEDHWHITKWVFSKSELS